MGAGLGEQCDRVVGERSLERRRHDAVVVHVNADDVGTELFQQVEEWRERRLLDHDAIAEADERRDHPVERVHRAVHHRECLGGNGHASRRTSPSAGRTGSSR